MTAIDALLTELQDEMYFRIKSEATFADVAVFRDRPGEISEASIGQALTTLNETGGKVGACAIVLRPRIVKVNQNSVLRFDAQITTRLLVTPVFNDDATTGTGKAVDALGLCVLRLGHQYKAGGRIPQMLAAADNAAEPYNEAIEEGTEGLDVTHEVPWGIESLTQCPAPAIDAASAAAVAITCALVAAAIYYTTDGSYPGSGNAAATLYTAPFAATSGDVIRAGAEDDDLVGSNTVIATVS